MNFVFSLEGVLRGDTGELIPDGLILYRSLAMVGRTVVITEMDEQLAKVWLMMHNLSKYDLLIDNSVLIDPDESLKRRQLAIARSRGTVSMYVDADPSMAAEALRQGIPTLLFSTPLYARPEYRPDAPKGIRKWDDIVAEKNRQQALKAVDDRLHKSDESMGYE
jgi:hypothetical protein